MAKGERTDHHFVRRIAAKIGWADGIVISRYPNPAPVGGQRAQPATKTGRPAVHGCRHGGKLSPSATTVAWPIARDQRCHQAKGVRRVIGRQRYALGREGSALSQDADRRRSRDPGPANRRRRADRRSNAHRRFGRRQHVPPARRQHRLLGRVCALACFSYQPHRFVDQRFRRFLHQGFMRLAINRFASDLQHHRNRQG